MSLSCILKTSESDVARMSSGSAFQAEGPACEKARSPNLVRRRYNQYCMYTWAPPPRSTRGTCTPTFWPSPGGTRGRLEQ